MGARRCPLGLGAPTTPRLVKRPPPREAESGPVNSSGASGYEPGRRQGEKKCS